MSKKFSSLIALALIAITVLAANLIASLLFPRVKLDITDEKLYTLSQGSKNIAADLQDEVAAKFFFAKTAANGVPILKTYASRIEQLLREYAAASKGKIRIELVDPKPDTPEEEAADRYGLQGLPSQSGLDRIYLGLVLTSESGDETTIPFFDPQKEEKLEYDISKALYTIANPEKKKIGIISSLPVMGSVPEQMNPMMPQQEQGQQPWIFVRQLRNTFKVDEIKTDAKAIPADIDLLMLIHPKELSETLQYAVDQFALGGGKVIAFLDPMCYSEQQQMAQMMQGNMQAMMQAQFHSDMPNLLKAWGVEMLASEPDKGSFNPMGGGGPAPSIVADPNLAQLVNTGRGQQEKLITWIALDKKGLSQNEIVTNELDSVMLVMAGAFKKTTSSPDIEAEILMESTGTAAAIDGMMMKFGINPEQLRRDFKPGDASLALAYKLSGKFKSAFPDGKPAADEEANEKEEDEQKTEEEAAGPHLAESKEPTTIIVVADVDMLANNFSTRVQNIFGQELVSYVNDNIPFLLNTAENMSGSQNLISLRSRGKMRRPFTRVQEIEQAAQEKYREKEQALNQELEDANNRLNELQQGTSDRQVLNAELAREMRNLRDKRADTSKALREVRRSLREDVEKLGNTLKFVNIALIPLLVVLAGLATGLARSMKRRHKKP